MLQCRPRTRAHSISPSYRHPLEASDGRGVLSLWVQSMRTDWWRWPRTLWILTLMPKYLWTSSQFIPRRIIVMIVLTRTILRPALVYYSVVLGTGQVYMASLVSLNLRKPGMFYHSLYTGPCDRPECAWCDDVIRHCDQKGLVCNIT